MSDIDNQEEIRLNKRIKLICIYSLAIIFGVLNGLYGNDHTVYCADVISLVFIRLFKFIAIPIIAVSIICTIASATGGGGNRLMLKRVLFYTFSTTLAAAGVAALLFKIFSPSAYTVTDSEMNLDNVAGTGSGNVSYIDNLISTFPDNIFGPFLEGKVLSVLFIAVMFGVAINHLKEGKQRETVMNFFNGLQQIFFVMVSWLIKILPLGIFGFITQCIAEFKTGVDLKGLGGYFATVITANLVQMFIVLPLFLAFKRLNPFRVFRGMLTALTVAFFSKSSAATLPVTMKCAENNCGVRFYVSRFVLPICTTINMNGCAAFIFITVIYLMQNAGMDVTAGTMIAWIFIATIAAIGNAGVPMGCFFLSMSLLASMDIPVMLMGLILPIYAVIDMLETSLNVWSDSCVANMVNRDIDNNMQANYLRAPNSRTVEGERQQLGSSD
jgi:Na+/H+-dicarboxylate symporter